MKIIANYIEKELQITDEYLLCIKNIEKLFDFFELIELSLTEDEYINLIIISEKLRMLLDVIIDMNIKKIQKNNYEITENEK